MPRFLIVLAWLSVCFAQKPKPVEVRPESWPLANLTITGNSRYSEQQILQASGLKRGQRVADPQFEAARARLMATGAFESIGYRFGPDADGKSVSGTIAVVEVEQVYPFRFEDLPAGDAELRAFLKQREPLFENRIPGTRELLTRISGEVLEFVRAKGFKDGVVGALGTDTPGELTVVFRPSTPRARIAEVKFTGNEALPAALLGNTFSMVAIGTAYTEQNVRQLLDSSIRPLYEARGRLRVTFPKIEMKKMATVDGVSVTVHVTDGPSFDFGKIAAQGAPLTSKELLSAANLKSGDPANFDAVRAGVDQIQKRFRAIGFMRSDTRFDREIHDPEKTVDVNFHTTAGPRFEMGKLNIRGLDVTSEPAIRKLWSMTAGKPFNADYPQFFLDKVREDGYLENLGKTGFSTEIHEAAHRVDVTLVFSGAPPEPEKKKREQEPI